MCTEIKRVPFVVVQHFSAQLSKESWSTKFWLNAKYKGGTMDKKILREIVRVLWPPVAVLCFFLGFSLGYKGCSAAPALRQT